MSKARVLLSTGSLYVMDVAQVFALAAEAGYDGIEIMCDARYSTRDPRSLRQLSEQYGLPVLVAHTPFSADLPGWIDVQDQVARIYHTLELAENLGCESIVVHLPYHVWFGSLTLASHTFTFPWLTPYKTVKTWIEQTLPDVQRSTHVKIALENMPLVRFWGLPLDVTWRNRVETWSTVHEWLTLDTTHWATKGVDPLVAYRAAKAHVCHVHLSNYNGQEHQLPQQGRLDLGAFLDELAADDYAGTVSLEVHPHVLEYQDAQALRRNLGDARRFCGDHLS